MLWLTFACCLVAAATTRADLFDKIEDYAVHTQNLFLDHIEELLGKYEGQFETLSHLPDDKHVEAVNARVHHLEENDCGENEYPCGYDSHHCLHELLFCDGHIDCPNGADEDKAICSAEPALVGRSYTGMVEWNGCFSNRREEFVLTVMKRRDEEHLGAHVEVTTSCSFKVGGEVVSVNGEGYFSVGKQELFLTYGSPKPLHVACFFDHGDHDHATCSYYLPHAETPCGTARIQRGG